MGRLPLRACNITKKIPIFAKQTAIIWSIRHYFNNKRSLEIKTIHRTKETLRTMKRIKRILLAAIMAVAPALLPAQKVFDMNLWQGGAPNNNGDEADTAKVRVYLPAAKEARGRIVVICPGGGYQHLAMEHEGYQWGPFFNNLGITAVVLKYRMPHGNPEIPLSDAEEAIRMVRRNAAKWGLSTCDVGIMGFSAGGHLASMVATHSLKEAKPDFQILFYPVITMLPDITHKGSHDNLLGKDVKKKIEREYSNDIQVSRVTPRAFIALSDDDHVVLPANGVSYYTELYRHDVQASLHVFPSGGHGWGIRERFKYHVEMELLLRAWLKSF